MIFAAAVACAFLVASCGGNQQNALVTKGSLSQFDSLSYAVGTNLAYMTKNQLSDIPLDFDVMVDALVAAAQGKNKIEQSEATAALQEYFTTKRQSRAAEVQKSRDAADSVALANGADKVAVREARKSLPADASMFENAAERTLISKALGNDLGSSIVNANIPAQTVWVKKSFNDVLAGEGQLTEAQANTALQVFFTVTLPAQNLEASTEWLATIESQEGVQKTESGLLYKIEVEGDETLKATQPTDVVKVKYTGKTRAGKVFDSSRYADMDEQRMEYIKAQNNGELPEDGETIEFPLNRVIPGWTEGMQLVGKGGRISLWIPSELAYGERGAGADIKGNDALYFDVELIDVVSTPAEE